MYNRARLGPSRLLLCLENADKGPVATSRKQRDLWEPIEACSEEWFSSCLSTGGFRKWFLLVYRVKMFTFNLTSHCYCNNR
jgi:hypothetical protein